MKKIFFILSLSLFSALAHGAWYIDPWGIPYSNFCRSGNWWSLMPYYGIMGTRCWFYDTNGYPLKGILTQE